MLTQKPSIAVIWCALSLLLWGLSLLGTPPSLCFVVAGAFSLQQGLQQSHSTFLFMVCASHVEFFGGSAPSICSQPSTLASLLEATTFNPCDASFFWPQKFSFLESFRCVHQDLNQEHSRSYSFEESFLFWGIGSRILAPS